VTSPDVPGLVTEGATAAEFRPMLKMPCKPCLRLWAELGKTPPPALQPIAIDREQTVENADNRRMKYQDIAKRLRELDAMRSSAVEALTANGNNPATAKSPQSPIGAAKTLPQAPSALSFVSLASHAASLAPSNSSSEFL